MKFKKLFYENERKDTKMYPFLSVLNIEKIQRKTDITLHL